MSDELNWDDVLGEVEAEEKENPDTGNSFEAIPKGPYNVLVQDTLSKPSASGKEMIKLELQVTDGPYANRKLFNYIVFSPENPKAMRMTLMRLGAFGITREFIATTRPSVGNIAELLVGRKAVAVVGIQESGDYKGSNEVKSFRAIEGEVQAAPTATSSKPAGVPNIPAPSVPSAPAGDPDENPFG